MVSSRKTGRAHVARKRRLRRSNDTYPVRLARKLGMPATGAALAGLSFADVRLAAEAYKRLRRKTFWETVRSLVSDDSLKNAFQDALAPQMLFRKEEIIPAFEVLDAEQHPQDTKDGIFRATIVVNDPTLAAQLAANPNIPTEPAADNFDPGPGKQAHTDQD